MADELTLRAEPRTVLGKKVRRLRREGLVPGVVYGPVLSETVSVSVNRRDFDKFYNRVGHSTIVNLEWDGGKQPVLIREVQIDPVRRDTLHIDFFAPNMRQKLQSAVPVILHNLSEDAHGVLQHVLNEVMVEALPNDLPHQIDVDVAGMLAVGDTLHVSDLSVPNGVEMITDGEELIASLIAEAVEEEPEEAAEEEGAEGEEGDGESTDDADASAEGDENTDD